MVEYKQSNPEDEFFAKENAEKMRRLRMKLDAERKTLEAKQLKEMHWMRCPKCGEQLQELPFKTIMIDKCTGCGGVWLDAGELDVVAGAEGNIFKKLITSLRDDAKK